MSHSDPSGGLTVRRRRLSDEQTRRQMLDAASGALSEAGLTVSLEHLSYEAVIQRAEVSRSAAYRIWATKEDFFDDLICELAGPKWQGTAAFDQETIDIAVSTVASRADQLSDPQGRLDALAEACRIGAERNFQALAALPQWRTYVALNATVLSMPESELKRRVQARLRESEAMFLANMAEFYRRMAAYLGYRLRAPFEGDFMVLAAVGAAVVEGLGLRRIVSPDIVAKTYRMAAFGSSVVADWSVPAIGFTSVLISMVEPDPTFDSSAIAELRESLVTASVGIAPALH
jgi:AcrR family transcriptional regulator